MANEQHGRLNVPDAEQDHAEPEPATITALLNSVPGAWERAREGIEDVKAGRVTELDEL